MHTKIDYLVQPTMSNFTILITNRQTLDHLDSPAPK
jgi:hypothetical protein